MRHGVVTALARAHSYEAASPYRQPGSGPGCKRKRFSGQYTTAEIGRSGSQRPVEAGSREPARLTSSRIGWVGRALGSLPGGGRAAEAAEEGQEPRGLERSGQPWLQKVVVRLAQPAEEVVVARRPERS